MFVTFYSYKGGVGRSLAMANVACLLAEDSEHPQRVLLWDFDLDAPGIHKLFPPKSPHSVGFVDLAKTFADTGEIAAVSEYIYESTVNGVDVLQAGSVDQSYCAALESIEWSGFFSADTTGLGPFFGPLVQSIKSIGYDYVLIDSRTGLGDQAGICTQVLPDLLVILFRLNEQNLDGLAHVVPAIREQLELRGKGSAEILPIASVVATTASEAVRRQRESAREVFAQKEFDYIRFDPDLVTEERLFCLQEERTRVWPTPYVVADYEKVCGLIRRRNESDTRTAASALRRKIQTEDHASAGAMIQELLPRRPRLGSLWRTLDRFYSFGVVSDSDGKKLVKKILEDDSNNPHATRWKALRALEAADSPDSDALAQAAGDLELALKHSAKPDKDEVLRDLARVYSCMGDLEAAEKTLRNSQALLPENVQVNIDLADLHLRMGMGHFTQAVEELEALPHRVDASKLRRLAYLRAFLGQPEKTEEVLGQWRESRGDDGWSRLVEAHVRVIQGKGDVALAIAKVAIGAKEQDYSVANWSELFLCAEAFDQALALLRGVESSEEAEPGLGGLIALVEYLRDGSSSQSEALKAWKEHSHGWSFDELIMFRERARREARSILADRLGIVEELIRFELLQQAKGARRYQIPGVRLVRSQMVK